MEQTCCEDEALTQCRKWSSVRREPIHGTCYNTAVQIMKPFYTSEAMGAFVYRRLPCKAPTAKKEMCPEMCSIESMWSVTFILFDFSRLPARWLRYSRATAQHCTSRHMLCHRTTLTQRYKRPRRNDTKDVRVSRTHVAQVTLSFPICDSDFFWVPRVYP